MNRVSIALLVIDEDEGQTRENALMSPYLYQRLFSRPITKS